MQFIYISSFIIYLLYLLQFIKIRMYNFYKNEFKKVFNSINFYFGYFQIILLNTVQFNTLVPKSFIIHL